MTLHQPESRPATSPARSATMDRCDFTDLPTEACAHCQGHTSTPPVLSIRHLERLAGKPLPQYRVIQLDTPHTSRRWSSGKHVDPAVVACDHPHPDGFICPECADRFWEAIHDVPALIVDLEAAFRKDIRFVDHGARPGDDTDESPIPWSQAASAALEAIRDELVYPDLHARLSWTPQRASLWMLANWGQILRDPNVAEVCQTITAVCAVARRAIDMPTNLTYVGSCPNCSDHGHTIDLMVEADANVITHGCGYAKPRREHVAACITSGREEWMTMDDLVFAIRQAGHQVTDKQIERWARTEGLPREERALPRWRDGRLDYRTVWTYRLGDVLDRVDQATHERTGVTLPQVAAELGITESALRNHVAAGTLVPIRPGAKPLRFLRHEIDRFTDVRKASA